MNWFIHVESKIPRKLRSTNINDLDQKLPTFSFNEIKDNKKGSIQRV